MNFSHIHMLWPAVLSPESMASRSIRKPVEQNKFAILSATAPEVQCCMLQYAAARNSHSTFTGLPSILNITLNRIQAQAELDGSMAAVHHTVLIQKPGKEVCHAG